jgi:TPR repeat protein
MLISQTLRSSYKIDQTPDQQGILDAPEWTFLAPAPASAGAVAPSAQTPVVPADTNAQAMATCSAIGSSRKLASKNTIKPCIDALAQDPQNAGLMLALGFSYQAAKNESEARKWYSQSAMNGSIPALNALGDLCYGDCAIKYYQEAAQKGDTDGMVLLAKAIMIGELIDVNNPIILTAFHWLNRAADKGNIEARKILNTRFAGYRER